MTYVYAIWRFLYNIFLKYSDFLEKNIFLNDPNTLFKYNSFFRLTLLKRLFLLNFYNKAKYKRLNIFIDNIDKINGVRLNFFTKNHNFFTKNHNDLLFSQTTLKRKNSIIKEINLNNINNSSYFLIDFVNLLILQNVRFSLTWRKLTKASIYSKYVLGNITYELINNQTVSGAMYYLSDDLDFNDERKKYNLNSFFNVKSEDLSPEDDQPIWHNDIFKEQIYDFNKSVKKYNDFFLKFTKFKMPKKNQDKTKKDKYEIEEYFGDIYLKSLKVAKYELNTFFKDFYKSLYLVKYRPTDNSQFLENSKNVSAMFIRKNKIFNKGRYSRNRQLYRTGVYWCLWLNIINVFGLYYYFYRFVFNFGYFYLPLLILILSFFGSRLVKYRFYNSATVIKEFTLFIELFSKFTTEIIKNFLIKSKELIIKLAVYIFHVILNFFKQN